MATILKTSLLTECEYIFRIINRKARTEEISCYWYNCLLGGGDLKAAAQGLSFSEGTTEASVDKLLAALGDREGDSVHDNSIFLRWE